MLIQQYITPTYVTFASEWDKLADASSETETFALSTSESLRGEHFLPSSKYHLTSDACKSLIEVLGMEALGGTESPTSNSVHTLNLSGMVSGGGGKVLARCRMTFASGSGVTLELAVRAEKEEVSRLIMAAI